MTSQALLFTKSHEWIEAAGATRKAGITDFAQDQLGDIVYVELPEPGKAVAAGDELCVIESTKATASVCAPVAGTVVLANAALGDEPQLVNEDPLGKGWLLELEVQAGAEGELMDATAYEAYCKEEEAKDGH
jgi:glycine cleavage system H protein